MADVIRKSTNRFTRGLVMDFSPENTKNEVLTHALNATLLTFNGNELSLQNDMGNARVETAYLPAGYIPVGTCEYGGIIYIVSYNPLEDKSLIGCFPSPERNVSRDELGEPIIKLTNGYFQGNDGEVIHNTQCVLLKSNNLNPGDKFVITADELIYKVSLSDLYIKDADKDIYTAKENPILALNVVSIEDSGKIVYLNSSIRLYDKSYNEENYKYHILGTDSILENSIESYRNVLSSGYNVFKSKTSGKLAILAELIMIDSYSVTHEIKPHKNNGEFDVIIHTDITPEITESNYNLVPKLQYYYLDNSLGYIQVSHPVLGNTTRPLFKIDETTNKVTKEYNNDFYNTPMNIIYTAIDEDVKSVIDPGGNKVSPTLGSLGLFNFPKPYTYHGRMIPYNGDVFGTVSNLIYTKFTEGKYYRINYSLVSPNIDYFIKDVLAKFYYYNSEENIYIKYEGETINETYTYYVREPAHIYNDAKRDIAHKDKELFILISYPATATEDQIYDTSIEKFQFQEIHTYRLATDKDKERGEKLYYKGEDGQTYILLTGTPEDDVTYYVLEIEENLVSIGFEIDLETIKGSIYYYPTKKDYRLATEEEIEKYYNFDTYKYESEAPYGCPITLYWKEENWVYVEATELLISEYVKEESELYYNTDYILLPQIKMDLGSGLLFMVVTMDTFIDSEHFEPNESYNYIEGKDKPEGDYPKDDPISLYTLADFIPENVDPDADDKENASKLKYNSIKLAGIKIPSVVYNNGLDLPFKYDYTIVPCMNYGKLDHLAVSNTISFDKLHDFERSNFNVWKYKIDDNLLRLTFGTEIFDTYEEYKVDGLILEFYDCWGFAGSVEITDKKSYSGVFTKILSLNTVDAISKKRVIGNKYEETQFSRNIKITTKDDGYVYNDKPVEYNERNGWCYADNTPLESSDCGTLYSNIIYGVKTYLKRTIADTKEYQHKRDFFLYTLPILNDYYYSVEDFSNIENPELDFVLTYKLVNNNDNNIRTEYSKEGFINGYNTSDNKIIGDYLSGNYTSNDPIDVTKYYNYKGTSDLYLEIGLKKDYEVLNIAYDPEINTKFSCTLKLINDEGESSVLVEKDLLNYGNYDFDNILEFEDNDDTLKKTSLEIITDEENTGIKKHNFLNFKGEPIKINYNFIVGYKVNISNIRETQAPATTVCALCHKRDDGTYNYEDFGIYERVFTTDDGELTKYLSSCAFYNEGDESTSIFGVCRQVNYEGSNAEQWQPVDEILTEAKDIKIPGKFNSGESLKEMSKYIGKLLFYQPYILTISNEYGTNVQNLEDNMIITNSGNSLKANTEIQTVNQSIISLNTKNSIDYYSEFIATVEYSYNLSVRNYLNYGISSTNFNKNIVDIMKHVYAYNPDYDQLKVNVGEVTLQNYNPSFTSNIISSDAKLELDDINEYIYLGPEKLADYLQNLHKHSEIITYSKDELDKINYLNNVTFKPSLLYCGEDNYLITSLTYNTPIPKELLEELEFTSSNITVIKDCEGNNTLVKGVPNKKTLYGKNGNKFVQLDVKNYNISTNNDLTINDNIVVKTKTDIFKNWYQSYMSNWFAGETFLYKFEEKNTINITPNLTTTSFIRVVGEYMYFAKKSHLNSYTSDPLISFSFLNSDTNYTTVIDNLSYDVDKVALKLGIENDYYTCLDDLAKMSDSDLTKIFDDGTIIINEHSYTIDQFGDYTDNEGYNFKITPSFNNNTLKFDCHGPLAYYILFIVRVKIKNINYSVMYNPHINLINDTFIHTEKTTKYSELKNKKYTVDSQKNLTYSTFTFNDLIYEPNIDGHRLFIRDGLCVYENDPPAIIFYRKDGDSINFTSHKNNIYIFTGPNLTS